MTVDVTREVEKTQRLTINNPIPNPNEAEMRRGNLQWMFSSVRVLDYKVEHIAIVKNKAVRTVGIRIRSIGTK